MDRSAVSPIAQVTTSLKPADEEMVRAVQRWGRSSTPCQCGNADMEATKGTLTYALEDYTIEVVGVPMKVCPDCGERLVPGPIALQLGEIVPAILEAIRESERALDVDHLPTTRMSIEYDERARQNEPALAFA